MICISIRKIKRFVTISIFLLIVATSCFSQLTELEAKKMVESSPCVINSFRSTKMHLRFARTEKFEDDLFNLQKKNYKKLEKAAYFFVISNQGTFITPSNEIHHSYASSDISKLIAVSKNNMKVYALNGCSNADDNFQRLIRDAKIEIKSAYNAESLAFLYFSLVKEPKLRSIVHNSREYRHRVENDFFNRFDRIMAKKKFKRWKKQFSKIHESIKFGVSTVKTKDGYRVSITYASLIQGEAPTLMKLVFNIDRVGNYILQKPIILFNKG